MQEIFDHPCLHHLVYLGLCRRLCQWSQVGWAWVEGLPITRPWGFGNFPTCCWPTNQSINQTSPKLPFSLIIALDIKLGLLQRITAPLYLNNLLLWIDQNHEQDSLKNIILFYLSEKEIKTLRMFHWVQLILTNFQIPITVDAIDFSRLRLKDKRFKN